MRLLIALAALLAVPSAASAAPPWTPAAVVAEGGVSTPEVLAGPDGTAVYWNGAPGLAGGLVTPTDEVFAAPVGGDGAPGVPRRVSRGVGELAAGGGRFTFAAVDGDGRLRAGFAGAPAARFAKRTVGAEPRGPRSSAAACGAAVAFAVRPKGRPGREYVALSRLVSGRFGPAVRISPRGRIRALTVASNAAGDVLAAWVRGGALEARIVTRRGVASAVRRVARTSVAQHLDAALAGDGRAVLGWLEQGVIEGEATSVATFRAAIRPAGGRFAPPRRLERYPDRVLAGGRGVRVAIAGPRILAAWTGRHEIRAAIAEGTRFGGAHQLALLGEGVYDRGGGIADLAPGPDGEALAVWVQPDENEAFVLAAPLRPGEDEFGSSEVVSEATPFIPRASAAFDPRSGRPVVAWWANQGELQRILAASRPVP